MKIVYVGKINVIVRIKKALTYDDVNIVPKYSELESRGDVKLNTKKLNHL